MMKQTKSIISSSLINILFISLFWLLIEINTQGLAQSERGTKSSFGEMIVEEINKARTNPLGYADWLEGKNANIKDTTTRKNINRAIAFLRNLPPLPAVKISSELMKVASETLSKNQADNAHNNKSYGLINIPFVSDNQVEKIVISLLNNRTEQKQIFGSGTEQTGIACNSSSKKCVIAYPISTTIADNNATEKNEKISSTANSLSSPSSSSVVPTSNQANNKDNPTPNSEQSLLDQDQVETTAMTKNYDLLEKGSLEDGDLVIPSDGSLYDAFVWRGKEGDSVVITLESNSFDTYLAVQDSQGDIIAENDDLSEGNSNSSLSIVLPEDGNYRLIVNSYDPKGRGDYTISVQRK